MVSVVVGLGAALNVAKPKKGHTVAVLDWVPLVSL